MAAREGNDQLQRLTDQVDIAGLIDRFLLSLDERVFDDSWARSMFTPDVRVEFPIGRYEGIRHVGDAIRRGIALFERTQHLGSNYVIRLDGDQATVRWNAIQTHIHRDPAEPSPDPRPMADLVSGGYYEGELVRTTDGWRFRRQIHQLVWATGDAPLTHDRPGHPDRGDTMS